MLRVMSRFRSLDKKAESIRNIVAVLAGSATILGVLATQGIIDWSWPPIHRPNKSTSQLAGGMTPTAFAIIDPPRMKQDVSIGTGCNDLQWDCSLLEVYDAEQLGVLVNFTIHLTDVNSEAVEVRWTVWKKASNSLSESKPVTDGPGWPEGYFPVNSTEQSSAGAVWVPYPDDIGTFFVELAVSGFENAVGSTIRTGTFDLPRPIVVPPVSTENAPSSIQPLPTIG